MCTNFKYPTAKDGTSCVGRTMEFPPVISWQLAVLAADHKGRSTVVPNGKSWQGKHGVVGFSAFDNPQWFVDATNNAGLSAHALYMPGLATYYDPKGDGSDISIIDAIAFVLGTCATTAEAKAVLATCTFVNVMPESIPIPMPLHIVVHDPTSCIVAEFHPDGMRILDNPAQVVTNSPYLDWHLTNVANYLGLSADNPAALEIDGTTFAAPGQGQGLRGLAADETGPSRFIRVLTNVRLAVQPEDQAEAEAGAIRVLHGFDVVPGTVMEQGPKGPMPLVTSWSTVSDLTAQHYLLNMYGQTQWYSIDVSATDFSTSRTVALPSGGGIQTVTV